MSEYVFQQDCQTPYGNVKKGEIMSIAKASADLLVKQGFVKVATAADKQKAAAKGGAKSADK